MASDQPYVLGSYVPIFFAAKDYFPDATDPDWTDFTSCTLSPAKTYCWVGWKSSDTGTETKTAFTLATKTIEGESVAGIQVSAADVAATLTTAGMWWVRIVADLAGDTKPVYSQWMPFRVSQ